MLPTEQLWEKEITKETLFVSLHSEQEAIPSWVLLTSELDKFYFYFFESRTANKNKALKRSRTPNISPVLFLLMKSIKPPRICVFTPLIITLMSRFIHPFFHPT